MVSAQSDNKISILALRMLFKFRKELRKDNMKEKMTLHNFIPFLSIIIQFKKKDSNFPGLLGKTQIII